MPPASAPTSPRRSGPAPVVEVSGRTFPVEVRWRPPMADEDGDEADLQQAVLAAVEEVAAIDRGDILIFMPTERHIHETAKTLRGRPLPGDPTGRQTEILPLYARLSMREQQRVFQPGRKRRDRDRHQRGRVVVDRAADSLRDRSGHGADQPLLAAEQDPTAADRGRFRGRRPTSARAAAGGSGRASACGCLASRITWPATPTRRRRSSGPTWRPSFCRPRPCGLARSSGSRSSTRPSPRPFATATERSSSSARSTPRAN